MVKILALALLLNGCASLESMSGIFKQETLKPDPNKVYRYDMKLAVNGYQGEGILVVPKAQTYNMDIEAKQKLDLFTMRSCHREVTQEGIQERSGIFGNKRKNVKISYVPTSLELNDCPLELGGYSKDTGKHSLAFIDFQNDTDTLPALLKCNGTQSNLPGVSACNSRYGLLQEISFASEVAVHPDEGCPLGDIKERSQGKIFQFALIKGFCTYIFKEVGGSRRTHRMTAIGYEDIFIRGEE